MAVQFEILGSLRIVVDGREVPLKSPKQRRLLGALLINAGSVVSTDRLAEILWGSDQPDDPSGTIQTHVSRLRALFHRWGGEEARRMLVTRPPGYALAADPDSVDAGRFEKLVEEARAVSTPQATADVLEEAMKLWRGRPLLEFDHEFASAESTRLEELRILAREMWADAMLVLGRYAQVAGELESVVARHPLREQLCGQLMVALDRCGRRADALAAYRELRDELVGELGMEPSAALRRLERGILQQDEHLPWPAPAAGVETAGDSSKEPRQRSGAGMTVLPEALTSFVGREEDVRSVTAALAGRRIVVLTGVGGVGKSRLAVRVARQLLDKYADGVMLCDLVSADDPEGVTDVVATALGVLPAESGNSEDALMTVLGAQQLLLVLDNCEHVVAGASDLVDRIGRTCPEVDVLATSRQPLGVAGEQIWPVEPLQVGDGRDEAAIALFCDRAVAVNPSFELTAAVRGTVVEICRRLDGLPLAVELAAAWIRSMTPADIAHRLDQRFELLVSGSRATPPRHRSLQTVVDLSYTLLPDTAQRLFDRLSLFAGSFGLDAAENVCAGDGVPAAEVAGGLAELIDHSLVAVDRSGRHARYRLLETLRDYGEARLGERGELPAWRRRHAEHFTSLAEGAAVGLHGPEEAQWVRIVDAEFPNLRAAHSWARAAGQVDLALRLPAWLCDYAYYRLRDEVFRWALRALEPPPAARSSTSAAARVAAGVGCMQRGELDLAVEHGRQALAASSDDFVVLRGLQLLTEIALYRGRLQETDMRGLEIVVRARAVGSAYYESLGHLLRVHAAAYAGRVEQAMARLEEGWQVVERAGNPSLRAGYCYLEGEVRLDDDPEAALRAFQQAVEIAQSVRNRFVEGVARVAAASLQARHGPPDEALRAFHEIVDHWRTSGDWVHMWTTLRNLLVLLERVGADEPAAVLFGAVETATTGARAFGTDAERLERTATSLRISLGEKAFATAAARGRGMSDGEAVAYVLSEIDRLSSARAAELL